MELDIPTEGLPVATKPYTVQLKYKEFVEHEIKQTQGSRNHLQKHE